MNCNGNCNQGRNCTCVTREPKVPLLEVIVILHLVAIAFACATLEFVVTGSARGTELTVVALIIAAAFCYALWWTAEKIIAAIDWMTRCE